MADLPELQHRRVAATARGFVLVALLVPMLWSRDAVALLAVGGLALTWSAATLAEFQPLVPRQAVGIAEAVAIGLLGGLAVHRAPAVLAAMAVPPFVGGLYRALWGVALGLSTAMAAFVAAALLVHHGLTASQGYAVFSWCFAGLGMGMIGTFLHSALQQRADPLAPYRYAQSLLRQLIDITEGLDSGLDPVALGEAILSDVRDELPATASGLYVPRGETLTPLLTRAVDPAELSGWESVAVKASSRRTGAVARRLVAVPVASPGAPVSAVVVVALSDRVTARSLGIEERLRKLQRRLQASAVHLDTALLFAAFRDSATAEERRRLAREMHDGVAQDIASLGYLVDALAGTATTPQQAERIAVLRDRITAVVAEIRRSLVNLRTSVGAGESLGAAIGSIARNLSEVSGVPIAVAADETTDRLRPEVESELFRIAQEAMNNAIKHAQASAIEVTCQVRAPHARITVSDNGRGLQAPREGSHGLSIMRERALLINASLEMAERPDGGLSVTVAIADGRDEGFPAESGRTRVEA